MNYNLYKKRVGTINDSLKMKENAIKFSDITFANSPNFQIVKLNGIDIDSRLIKKDTKVSELITKELVEIGDYIESGVDKYICLKREDSQILNKATIYLCNSLITIDLNSYGVHFIFNGSLDLDSEKYIYEKSGQATIYIRYDEKTKNLKENSKLSINGETFEVIGADRISNVFKGKGFIVLYLKPSVTTSQQNGSVTNNKANQGWG